MITFTLKKQINNNWVIYGPKGNEIHSYQDPNYSHAIDYARAYISSWPSSSLIIEE